MKKNSPAYEWTAAEKFLVRWAFAFIVLFVTSFSFPHAWLPDVGSRLSPFYETAAAWTGDCLFRIRRPYTRSLLSDSTGMYLHAFNLLAFSALAGAAWSLKDKGKQDSHPRLLFWLLVVLRYYLAMQLLAYGWNKVFKWQFYLPEPNTLFTTIGHTGSDLLYWNALGASRPYVVATGLFEVSAALLLFFRRTQLAGGLLAFMTMAHVVLINFSFDISVKLYSLFLLFLTVVLIIPFGGRLWQALTMQPFAAGMISPALPAFYHTHRLLYRIFKLLLVLFLLADSLVLYMEAGNYNDDAAPRPALYGAYSVETFVHNRDTLPPLLTDTVRWRRVFVHSKGYFIVQKMNDDTQDFELQYDSEKPALWLSVPSDTVETAWQYLLLTDSTLELRGWIEDDSVSMRLHKIPLQHLPLLQKEFHWTIDE